MKKILSVLVLTGLLVIPVVGLADVYDPTDPSNTPETLIESGDDLILLIDTIGNWIFAILLGIAAIMLILAGFFWITAGGDPTKVTTASAMLKNALIGVAIALGAKGLVMVIGSLLGANISV